MTKPAVRRLDVRVTRVTLLLQESGRDIISLTTDLPSPFPVATEAEPLTVEFRCAKGTGREYLKKHFGWDPDEVFGDDRPPRLKFSKE